MNIKNIILFIFVKAAVILLAVSSPTFGSILSSDTFHGAADTFNFRLTLIGYGLFQDVEESRINPYNILGIPQKRMEMDLRPDFFISLNALDLEIKPRFTADYNHWDDGLFENREDAGKSEVYINEWLTRLKINNKLFISGGRENLQWGPSLLLSVSNPFFQDNGRNNPSLELPGLDYARAVLIPGSAWTFSMIANIGKGQAKTILDFKNVYAIKIDFTGEEKYLSLIGSCRENEKPTAGFFGGMTMTEAILVYAEGSASAEDESADILAGGSFTLMDGSILSIEYFHHGSGCTREPIESCIFSQDLYQELLDRFKGFTGTIDELLDAIQDLELDVDKVSFIRKNYLLLQYSKPRIWDVLSLTMRLIYNIDDVSGRTVGLVNYELNNHIEIFGVGNLYPGAGDTEYGSLINYSLMAGMSFKL